MKRKNIILSVILFIFTALPAFSQMTVEQTEQLERQIEKEKLLRKKIEAEKIETPIEEKMPVPEPPKESEQKVLIQKIVVTGATLLPEKEISGIISPYQNKELTIREMQKVADLISDAYRRRGYITSRAYLPPQKIEQGILEIWVLEGLTGNIEVKGNRYFKTRLIRDKIALKKGQPFNYDYLRKGLTLINQLPDRNAKAIITPGREPGTTDVILEVKDHLPIHLGFNFDNYGSRYIDKNRYRATLTHNNFLGLDDILTFQYQISNAENYRLLNLGYLFPINQALKVGFSVSDSRTDLRREYEDEDLNGRGKSKFYSFYAAQSLIKKDNFSLNLNLGFDHKDIFNFQQGNETSRDRLRVIKAGLDSDLTDKSGRTLISNEINYGMGGILSGLDRVDIRASRRGSGGKFFKDNLYLIRLQKLPFNSSLLWKNQFQFTAYILTASEQFQIGGIVNVRGYPPAEVVGDRGYSMTWEWLIPPYPISKKIKFPFSEAKLYDSIRVVTFYDWANVRLKRPTGTEQKNRTLRGAGWGLRINLPGNFSLHIETAWPLDNTPSDSDNVRTWAEVAKTF